MESIKELKLAANQDAFINETKLYNDNITFQQHKLKKQLYNNEKEKNLIKKNKQNFFNELPLNDWNESSKLSLIKNII